MILGILLFVVGLIGGYCAHYLEVSKWMNELKECLKSMGTHEKEIYEIGREALIENIELKKRLKELEET